MSNRRISLSKLRTDEDKTIATADGLADEQMTTELYQMYGFSTNPTGDNESVLMEINGDPDNFIALPPVGYRQAKEGETLIYHGGSTISLTEDSITILVGDHNFAIKDGKVTTDMDIITSGDIQAKNIKASGDVKAVNVSLRYHKHPAPDGITGTPY